MTQSTQQFTHSRCENKGFHAFYTRLLAWSESQEASARSWTRVADSISYDDNCAAKCNLVFSLFKFTALLSILYRTIYVHRFLNSFSDLPLIQFNSSQLGLRIFFSFSFSSLHLSLYVDFFPSTSSSLSSPSGFTRLPIEFSSLRFTSRLTHLFMLALNYSTCVNVCDLFVSWTVMLPSV